MQQAVTASLLVATLGACGVSADEGETSTTDTSITKRETNQIFATQWGPTQFNSAGVPDGYDDCGPTSLLMGAAFLGYVPAPTAADAEAGIRYMRDLTRGAPTPVSGGTSAAMMSRGLAALDAQAYVDTVSIGTVNAVLDSGGIVFLAGDPKHAWGLGLDGRGEYLHHYSGSAADVFAHWVAVVGYSSTGRDYVVADPLSTIGAIDVSATQIERFWSDIAYDAEPAGVIEMHAPGR